MNSTKIEIETRIVKFFIRELKERNLLNLLYETTDMGNLFKAFKRINKSQYRENPKMSDSPFIKCKKIEDIVNVLDMINNKMGSSYFNANDEAQLITMCINHLIHFFVEGYFAQKNMFNEVHMFGQNVFNNTVASLYGHNEVQNYNERSNSNILPNEIKQKLWNDYLNESSNGNINVSFEVYVAEKLRDIFERQRNGIGVSRLMPVDPFDEGEFIEEDEWFDETLND